MVIKKELIRIEVLDNSKKHRFINSILFKCFKVSFLNKMRKNQYLGHSFGFKEMYKAKEKVKDPHKIEINKIIGKYVKDRRDGFALILDSEKLLTTKALVKNGFKRNHIEIPNPFIYDKIKGKHNNSHNRLLSEHLDLVKQFGKTEYTITFFDYCCSLDGNERVKPMEDINKYFAFYLPKHNSIFAVTICKRNRNNKEASDLNRLDALITKSAYNYGYVAIKEPVGYPYNNMYFVLYKIKAYEED